MAVKFRRQKSEISEIVRSFFPIDFRVDLVVVFPSMTTSKSKRMNAVLGRIGQRLRNPTGSERDQYYGQWRITKFFLEEGVGEMC